MDPFEDIVSNMDVQSSLYVSMDFRAPWGIAFDTGPQARIVMVVSGRCAMKSRDEDIEMGSGDCLIVKAGTEFSMSDEPGRVTIPCDQVFTQITGRTVTHGRDGDRLEMVSARLTFDPLAGEPLLALLPDIVHVSLPSADAQMIRATMALIGIETSEDGLGAGLILNRLTDILFVQVIRSWLGGEGRVSTGWLAGLKSRKLATAIKAMHADLAHPWTVGSLARKAGLSRASFAAAFRTVTGETPLGYLTNWRMYRAKALLRAGRGLADVAAEVGYDSETALSRAFKRVEGVPPGVWRSAATQGIEMSRPEMATGT